MTESRFISIKKLLVLFTALIFLTGCSNKSKDAISFNKDNFNSKTALSFSKTSGNYEEFSLTLKSDIKDAKIYYTLDGSDPTTSKTKKLYEKPIEVKSRENDENDIAAIDPIKFDSVNIKLNKKRTAFEAKSKAPDKEDVDKITVVKAYAKNKAGETKVITHSYFTGDMTDHIEGIKESCKASGKKLAIMSLSTDKDNLFDDTKGIYVKGDVYNEALKEHMDDEGKINDGDPVEMSRRLEANYNQRGKEWEREIHMDYFESDGDSTSLKLSQDCGIRISGNYSRGDLNKGLRLYARKKYGNKTFKYPFFEESKDTKGKVVQKFKKLSLRNGGNCAFTGRYQDAYWQSMMSDLYISTQASRPCVVYINGEYFGLYVLQEDFCGKYYEQKYGVFDDSVVSYKGDAEKYARGYALDDGQLPEEVDESYYFEDLNNFFESHEDLKSKEHYEQFTKMVDPNFVMDYFAANVWLDNKWDWPGKNWTAWRTIKKDAKVDYADDRWRLCIYDLDFGGFSGANDAVTNTIQVDGYSPDDKGLLSFETDNPIRLMFAYLMTNEEFRNKYIERLDKLTEENFETKQAIEKLDTINDTYSPLMEQFFDRYGVGSMGAVEDSYNNLKEFMEERPKHIKQMKDWIKKQYK
ncbi:MAG: CotH kinase family protein [Lachnospiraceae bacterium]|nr:CotH kinase family protein [Lachnospiraceae bacterium]